MNEIEAVGEEVLSEPPPAGGPPVKDRPWLFGLLIAPSAVLMNGVIQGGVLAYLLSQQGIGSGGQSHLIGLLALPTSLYFLWSPITDFFVRRRTWLLVGGLLAAVLMAAGFHQKNLSSSGAVVLMLLSACLSQLVVSSCGGMMGAMSVERSRRVAGSFYQAGSMGFGALAAWVLVWLSSRANRDVLGLTAAVLIGAPALFALVAPAQETMAAGVFSDTMGRIWTEFKATFFRWKAVPYTLCMVFPMASGSAVGLLSGVAKQYGVNGDSVAWMNGLLGGLLMAGGSAAAAVLPTKMRAAVMYMIVALVNCATLCVLWLGPLRPSTYYLGVTLYLFTVGTCYAMFTAVVLEFLGHSGKSGSGRYSIINSLGNVPVLYMLTLDGWGGDKWGPRGLAGTEAVVGAVGAVILLAYFLSHKPVDASQGATPVEA
jgi:MFS transporter, PAT family, beta-lactamase induction signal transducer AmpG